MKSKIALILSLVLISSVSSVHAKKAKGKNLDTDGDHKVSLTEFLVGKKNKSKAEKRFAKLDKNGDGFLTPDELKGKKKKKK